MDTKSKTKQRSKSPICVSLRNETIEKIKAIAIEEDRTVSKVVSRIVEAHFNNTKQENK